MSGGVGLWDVVPVTGASGGPGISSWGEKGKGLLSSSTSVLQTLCLECQLLGTTVSELDASYWSQTGGVGTLSLWCQLMRQVRAFSVPKIATGVKEPAFSEVRAGDP